MAWLSRPCCVALAADELGEGTPPEVLANCAEFFMKHKQFDKAVHLLLEGKRYSEVCSGGAPAVMLMCAVVVADDALGLAPRCRSRVDAVDAATVCQAIDLAATHKVKVTDEMAERMTPPKVDDADVDGNARRNDLLCKLANLCKKQGSYHLATKKFTQVRSAGGAQACVARVVVRVGVTIARCCGRCNRPATSCER
jgi:intraflagellar transport protein 140